MAYVIVTPPDILKERAIERLKLAVRSGSVASMKDAVHVLKGTARFLRDYSYPGSSQRSDARDLLRLADMTREMIALKRRDDGSAFATATTYVRGFADSLRVHKWKRSV